MAKKPSLTDLFTANAQTRSGSGANTETNTRLISVYDITPNAGNFYDVTDIAALKQSIELIGLQQNLVVKSLGGGKYEAISGHRRLRACIELADEGKSEFQRVPCKVSTASDTLLERLELIMTNSTARHLSDFEQVRQARELRDILTALKDRDNIGGRVRDLVAEAMNTSAAKIGRLDAIDHNLAPVFKAKLESGDIALTTAYEISGLTVEQQEAAYESYKQSGTVTVEEIKAFKQELNASEQITDNSEQLRKQDKRTLFDKVTASPRDLAEWLAETYCCPLKLKREQICPNRLAQTFGNCSNCLTKLLEEGG
jgi:ParB family chromosome partitioning protein